MLGDFDFERERVDKRVVNGDEINDLVAEGDNVRLESLGVVSVEPRDNRRVISAVVAVADVAKRLVEREHCIAPFGWVGLTTETGVAFRDVLIDASLNVARNLLQGNWRVLNAVLGDGVLEAHKHFGLFRVLTHNGLAVKAARLFVVLVEFAVDNPTVVALLAVKEVTLNGREGNCETNAHWICLSEIGVDDVGEELVIDEGFGFLRKMRVDFVDVESAAIRERFVHLLNHSHDPSFESVLWCDLKLEH